MEKMNQPTKEQVRQWLARRRQHPAPIPDAQQIRDQLGWEQDSHACQQPIQRAA